MEEHVKELMKKAADAHAATDALHFSQAALNGANAMCALKTAGRDPSTSTPPATRPPVM